MSLTRNEWLEVWEAIKIIERTAVNLSHNNSKQSKVVILRNSDRIKEKIQQVIGQME